MSEPGDPLDLEDDALVASIDAEMAAAIARAGRRFGCGPGRSECCLGPFPINLLDARRLQRGLRALEAEQPARAEAVRRRAREAVAALRDYPGDRDSGLLDEDEAAEERFCERHRGLPCPALDPPSGGCDLYAWRPLACRTLGPPVILAGQPLPPCPFCFDARDRDTEALAACTARPDPQRREEPLLARLEARLGRCGDTIIAFALGSRPRAL